MTQRKRHDARHMSLGIDGVWDVFRKLKWEVELFKSLSDIKVAPGDDAAASIRLPMYAAINAASTAWALVEWVWVEVEHDEWRSNELRRIFDLKNKGGVNDLKSAVRKTEEVNVCYNISHAAKHAHLERMTAGLCTPLSYSLWEKDPTGDPLFSVSAMSSLIKTDGRSDQTIESLLNQMVRWWEHLLSEQLCIVDPLSAPSMTR